MLDLEDWVRKQLEDERNQLQVHLLRSNGASNDQVGYGNHPADYATDVFDHTLNLTLCHHYERRLLEVENAFRRLEQGTYGICEKCGQAIDPARLKALPEAVLCIKCKGGL